MRGCRAAATIAGVTFVEPQYSRREVKRAGRAYVDSSTSAVDKAAAVAVINNWKSAHGYPLNTHQMTLRRVVREVDEKAWVAQRIKRLPSIRHKLERFPTLDVSQMQDLGGCRAIVKDVRTVDAVVEHYLVRSRAKHKLVRHDDYISNPKVSGYRGVHLVYAYNSARRGTWNGLKTELQIRSKLQHSWATAVETVGLFTSQALKSSQGEEDWLRFFVLMGTAHALREGRTPVPCSPADVGALQEELRSLCDELGVLGRLDAYRASLRMAQLTDTKADRFVMELDLKDRRLRVRPFFDAAEAAEYYSSVEAANEDNPHKDAVMVKVESVQTLKRAYPNYFLDTTAFAKTVRDALEAELT